MSRVPQKFRRTEVVRAIRAAETAGLKVAGVEIEPTGKIRITVGEPDTSRDENEWDNAAA
jgi:hypothetical protein